MKKILIATLVSVMFISSAFAKKVSVVNSQALRSFRSDFAGATNVKWTSMDTYSWVSFSMKNEQVRAYYDTDGSLIGTGKSIQMDQLPTASKRAFAKRYSDYNVNEIMEFTAEYETAYFISATNEKETVILKLEAAGISRMKNSKF
ncbi:hypothetical protein EXU57_18425 [Segetibacter sp. 3557_3]|uniref:hypothetical protein n=1 Tax=Segetibacter sp. 3557_3 TaxID=2547429 RepID=UPI001058DCA1|nr:hypothetical protein [Segetibacter sp. 3557_3]TDH23036.1 hypothetical protein EXU57_18425 [Segetibacter sp. 3557_3]